MKTEMGAVSMNELEDSLKYCFVNRNLLKTALSHSSYANENKANRIPSNERLEFLGDSILGLVVARHLYSNFHNMPEGHMTKLRAELVCEANLHRLAMNLDLGRHIMLGRGESNSGGRERGSILADAVEAIIAAIYLDGGMEPASTFIERNLLSGEELVAPGSSDYKTSLQELIQRTPGQTLTYQMVSESGPDHNKTFFVRVLLNDKVVGEGEGRTKKDAEQCAARRALEEF